MSPAKLILKTAFSSVTVSLLLSLSVSGYNSLQVWLFFEKHSFGTFSSGLDLKNNTPSLPLSADTSLTTTPPEKTSTKIQKDINRIQ